MSVVQTSEGAKYFVLEARPFWRVHEHDCPCCGGRGYVDMFKTRSAAEYFARLLNDGLATVNHHAVVGCRVEVK